MEKQERRSHNRLQGPEKRSARSSTPAAVPVASRLVQVQAGPVALNGDLQIPEAARALVVFVHGSGSSRYSPRNQQVASSIHAAGIGTLLFDLLTLEEEEMDLQTSHLRFNIGLLARRTIGTVDWLMQQPMTSRLALGFFAASTGAAAALIAASERPEAARALVLRDGRSDLAIAALPRLQAPVLLIAGQLDETLRAINKQALALLNPKIEKALETIPSAGMRLQESDITDRVACLAVDWFKLHLPNRIKRANKD